MKIAVAINTPARRRSRFRSSRAVILGLLTLATFAAPARAVPFAVDRLVAGDGQLTRDTASGLDWLDVSLTRSRTTSDVAVLTGSGGVYEGYRLATVSEFVSLLSNAGAPHTAGASDSNASRVASAQNLQALLGSTFSLQNNSDWATYSTYGWLGGGSILNANFARLTIEDYGVGSAVSDFYLSTAGSSGGPSQSYNIYGLWLVRDQGASGVPDAGSTIGLLALSIAGLLAVRRRLAAAIS